MKLATYNPSVRLNAGGNARVVAPDVGAADMIGAKTMANVAAGIQRVGEQFDSVNVQAAENEYNKRLNDLLYNQENGLMNTQLQGADGITQKFEEEEKKIRQEVSGKYNFFTLKGNNVFGRMTNDSAAKRYELVRKHQTQQYNAYKDVTFGNAVEDRAQFATDNFADPEALASSIAETERLTAAQYFGQGEEQLAAQTRKNCGIVAGRALAAALANDDVTTVDNIRNKYGKYLSPEQSINVMKMSNKIAQENSELQLCKDAYAACGDNPEAISKYVEDYCAKTGGNADAVLECFRQTKGQPYLLGAAEDGVNGNWDCGAWTKWVAKKSGLGSVITNRCADTQFKQMEDAGRAFGPNQESRLKTGDFVFWTGTGGEEGYKGIAHVGIYNAQTGKVMQSGTAGVREIDLHAYPIVGFGRGAGGVGRTPAEVERLRNKALSYIASEKGKARAYMNEQIHQANLEIQDKMNSGEDDPSVYRGIINKYILANPNSPNDELRIQLETKLGAIEKGIEKRNTSSLGSDGSSEGGSSSGSAKNNALAVYELGQRLQQGESPEALRLNVLSGPYSTSDKAKMMKMIDEVNDTLTNKYDVKDIVKDMVGFAGKGKAAYTDTLTNQTAGDIARFIGTNNRPPTVKEIQDMVRYNMTSQKSGFFGDSMSAPVDFKMNSGADTYVRNMRDGKPDGYNVLYQGKWVHISDRQAKAVDSGEMTMQEAIREGYR